MPLDCANYIEPLTDTEQEAKADLYRWLDRFPERVPGLLEAVREGRITGQSILGRCRCVLGQLSHEYGDPEDHRKAVAAFAFRPVDGMGSAEHAPIERFVWSVGPGHTPADSPVMAHLERWIMEWRG
jgi:hypothetical protein